MPDEYAVRKVPRVDLVAIRPGETGRQAPIKQYSFVVERIVTNEDTDDERHSEHDVEADAIAECERLNAQ